MTLLGFDTSYNNHKHGTAPHDWGAIYAAGYHYVAIRCTVGRYYRDPWFHADYEGAKAAGLLVTAYTVPVPDQDDPPQVANFLAHLGARPLDWPIAIDMEIRPASVPGRAMRTFDYHVYNLPRVNGQMPLTYTNQAYANQYLKSTLGTRLWVASPGSGGLYNTAPKPTMPKLWKDYVIWQRSWSETIPGIVDPTVDLDEYPGTLEQFRAEFGISMPEPPGGDKLKYRVTASPYLNVRSGPGTNFPDVGNLPSHTEFEVLDIKAGAPVCSTWLQIKGGQYDGKWVCLVLNGQYYAEPV